MTALPDLTGVPALTLHQPWAHAIAHLGKRRENRGWRRPSHISRLLIHAGKASDPEGWDTLREFGFGVNPDVVQSAIVAVADVIGVCDAARRDRPCQCGRWASAGQYHWLLGTVWTLTRPVEHVRGRQGLWYPDADVLRQAQAAGAEVAQ